MENNNLTSEHCYTNGRCIYYHDINVLDSFCSCPLHCGMKRKNQDPQNPGPIKMVMSQKAIVVQGNE